jgi:hypothetical protein
MHVRFVGLAKGLGVFTFLTIMMTGAVHAEINRSKTLILVRDTELKHHILKGYTRGTIDLHDVVGSRDINNNRCFGYGSIDPDHVITLKQRLPKLTLQVKSKYPDTTLIVKGPGQALYCADDSPSGPAAQLELTHPKSGTYKVWVGSFDQGARVRYNLEVNQSEAVSQN